MCSKYEPSSITALFEFPSRSLVLQFAESEPLRSFCATLLNESSMYLSKSRDPSAIIAFLQHRLDLVSLLINELPFPKCQPKNNSKSKSGSKKPLKQASNNQYAFVPPALSKPTIHGTVVPPIVGVLYTLKYMLIYRIASIKNMLPYSDFVDVLYPPELSRMTNSNEKGYVAHFIHLSCILHSCFSIPKHLEFIAARRESRMSTSHPPLSSDTKPVTTAKPSVVEEKLCKVVLELVQTEEIFLEDLHQLLVQYVGPAELKCLECVKELHKTHYQLLESLKDAVGDLSSSSSTEGMQRSNTGDLLFSYAQIKDIVMRISALFINKCNKFKVYSEYASAHLQFQRLQKDNHQLSQMLQMLNVKGQQSESAESLMIKPIQRILKVILSFLAQIQENCPAESMERNQCSQALDRMQMLATYINEMQRIQEEYGQELDKTCISEELVNKGLRVDLRDLLMFAQLKWWQADENNYIDCVAFVFKFFILLMKKNKKGHAKKDCPTVVLPIWMVEVNESESVPVSSSFSREDFSSSHDFCLVFRPASSNLKEAGAEEMIVYYLSCCHTDIKEHFIRSVNKGLKASIKLKMRPTSCQSSQSDWGYASGR